MASCYSVAIVLEQCRAVGLRLRLAPYAMLGTVVLVGRCSWRLLFQGASSELRTSQV
jgi:hypothetical protein